MNFQILRTSEPSQIMDHYFIIISWIDPHNNWEIKHAIQMQQFCLLCIVLDLSLLSTGTLLRFIPKLEPFGHNG